MFKLYIKGKLSNKSFFKSQKSINLVLEIVHYDNYRSFRIKIHKRIKECFITFTYDYLRYGHFYLLRLKYEVIEKSKEYKVEVELSWVAP